MAELRYIATYDDQASTRCHDQKEKKKIGYQNFHFWYTISKYFHVKQSEKTRKAIYILSRTQPLFFFFFFFVFSLFCFVFFCQARTRTHWRTTYKLKTRKFWITTRKSNHKQPKLNENAVAAAPYEISPISTTRTHAESPSNALPFLFLLNFMPYRALSVSEISTFSNLSVLGRRSKSLSQGHWRTCSVGEPGTKGTNPRPPKTGRMKASSNFRQ